ncbi:hypothetical protein QBC35DRAFT_502737 [Podospora australis]|uniref:Uncharacterized protein n=1 Tax=Podospora australis TaxID=1536484 RepID=A0AAN7AHG4_9PEZI|nr:hypothetical protein QBC35DRAFT_502737 [Podospora australis]
MNSPRSSGPGSGRPRNLVHALSLRYLLVVPVLLAVLTGVVLFQHSDTNIYMLWSQCHARSRIPWLSHIPLLGTPSCFLVSFFQESAASLRSKALLSIIFSFLSGLLTVSTVEAARICNGPSILIAYPTGPWLIFDLIGGAFVWELVIIPAFFHRSRAIINARKDQQELPVGAADPIFGESMRHLAKTAEGLAIPVAVALGFVLPSILMLTIDSSVTVLIWLFFPVWTNLIRQGIRKGVTILFPDNNSEDGSGGSWQETLHLESNKVALIGVYAVPILCSAAAHIFFLWSLTQGDDRKEMTRSTVKFITIDAFFVGLTVLYWILVEAGWKVSLVMALASLVAGPGAGICLGWIYREQTVDPDRGVTQVVAVGVPRRSSADSSGHPSEETPLLR